MVFSHWFSMNVANIVFIIMSVTVGQPESDSYKDIAHSTVDCYSSVE